MVVESPTIYTGASKAAPQPTPIQVLKLRHSTTHPLFHIRTAQVLLNLSEASYGGVCRTDSTDRAPCSWLDNTQTS